MKDHYILSFYYQRSGLHQMYCISCLYRSSEQQDLSWSNQSRRSPFDPVGGRNGEWTVPSAQEQTAYE